jgi:hypothetical protein
MRARLYLWHHCPLFSRDLSRWLCRFLRFAVHWTAPSLCFSGCALLQALALSPAHRQIWPCRLAPGCNVPITFMSFTHELSPAACRYVTMTHIIHSSDTVKDCAPTVVHACVTMLAAICRLHSVCDVADAARNWARLCEALVSVHLKSIVKQV